MDETARIIGRRIKECREKKGMTQQEVATILGVVKQTVSSWERGNSPPLVTNLVKFAAVMEAGTDDFLVGLEGAISSDDQLFIRQRISQQVLPLLDPASAAEHLIKATTAKPSKFVPTRITRFNNCTDVALEIDDGSMMPRFHEGDYVILREASTADPGRFVLARVRGQYLFRRYRPAAMHSHVGAKLLALNPDWPEILMGDEDQIFGTMIEHTSSRVT